MAIKHKKIIAIVPAFNEEGQISSVLSALSKVDILDEIVVVNDGSEDRTAKAVKVFSVTLIDHKVNHGKGAAMESGINYALKKGADILTFFDADLIGLTSRKIQALIKPLILNKKLLMTVGVFERNKKKQKETTLEYSGQRAMKKEFFRGLSPLLHAGFGVELLLTSHLEKIAKVRGVSISTLRKKIRFEGIIHVIKEKKYGPIEGFGARIKMGLDITKVPLEFFRNDMLKKFSETSGINFEELVQESEKRKFSKKLKKDQKKAENRLKFKKWQQEWKKILNQK